MGQYLNVGKTGFFHMHKIHCSLTIFSLEVIKFEINGVLNLKKIFCIKIKMLTFIKKESQVVKKKCIELEENKKFLISETREDT
jgi:hypothetical protein